MKTLQVNYVWCKDFEAGHTTLSVRKKTKKDRKIKKAWKASQRVWYLAIIQNDTNAIKKYNKAMQRHSKISGIKFNNYKKQPKISIFNLLVG